MQLAATLARGVLGMESVGGVPLPDASAATGLLDVAFGVAAVAAWRTEEEQAEERAEAIWKEVQARAKRRAKPGKAKAKAQAKGFGGVVAKEAVTATPAQEEAEATEEEAAVAAGESQRAGGGVLDGARALFDEANANAKAQALVLSQALDEWEDEQKRRGDAE